MLTITFSILLVVEYLTLSSAYRAISVFVAVRKSDMYKLKSIGNILELHILWYTCINLFDMRVSAIYSDGETARIEKISNDVEDNCRCVKP